MDLASLQISHSPNLPAGQKLPSADPASTWSTLTPLQSNPGLPGKAIGQRRCVIDWYSASDSDDSDGRYFDARQLNVSRPVDSSDDDYCDVPVRLTGAHQQTIKSQGSDGDGQRQLVTPRRSRSEPSQSLAVATGNSDARAKNEAREKIASASRLSESCSAGDGVSEQNQHLQLCSKDPVSLSSLTSCFYWPLCLESFARLSQVDWKSFQAGLVNVPQYRQKNITRGCFQHFRQMMTEGSQAIRKGDDLVFLVDPFRVLLSIHELSSEIILLSLVFERVAPGFLKILGARFVGGLFGVDSRREKLFTAITELLAQICQEGEGWLDRLDWRNLSVRDRCNLFSSIAFLFKTSNKVDLIRNLHQQVGGSWLQKHHYATVQRLSCNSSDPDNGLRDLRATVRAIFLWLDGRFFIFKEARRRQVACFANVAESVIEPMSSLGRQPDSLLLGVWQIIAQWSINFRNHLSSHLGFDRTITLLNRLVQQFDRWPELDSLAFELRLTLLATVLMKCEELSLKRNSTLFPRAWHQYQNMLESLLAECNRFMANYPPPLADDDKSLYTQRKEDARMNLRLRESAFFRLDCQSRRTTQQRIQHNLLISRKAFIDSWALSKNHLESGAIELAKWYFLAGERDAGARFLMHYCFENARLSSRKAELLARHGMYQEAVDEYQHVKVLLSGSNEFNQRKQDDVDDRIAMTQYQWYHAENNTDHLISAYRRSVDLLGRCDIRDRVRFEGVLDFIVNAMKRRGLRFENYVKETSVLDYLVKDGCSIKSWHHFAELLHIHRKSGLTNADTIDKVASGIDGKYQVYLRQADKS